MSPETGMDGFWVGLEPTFAEIDFRFLSTVLPVGLTTRNP